MWKIKEWMSSHETLCALIALLLFYGAVDIVLGFAGKTYVKYRSNEYSYEIAIEEFERVCGEYMVLTENEYESEYYKFYDNKAEAINDFMNLVLVFDGIYANGKIRHWYVWGKERVYRCCDKNKNRIAIRFLKHRRMGINWKPDYELTFFVEKY